MRVTYGLSLVVLTAVCSLALAEDQREERRGERGAAATRILPAQRAAGTADQQIAACLYAANRNEIEISKLAEDKSQNEEVRAFAAMMVKAHTPVFEKLQQAAGGLVRGHSADSPAAGVRRLEEREVREERREVRVENKEETKVPPRRQPPVKEGDKENTDEPVAAPASEGRVVSGAAIEGRIGRANVLDWVAIHQQVADECLASAKAELQKKEGAEFDHCYIGGQIMVHMKVLDEVKVLKKYASAEMKKELEQSAEMTERHLEKAKQIAASLMGESKRTSLKPKSE